MRFLDFKSSLKDFPLFSIADIRAAQGNFDHRRLNEWQQKGYIKKIIKGHYLFSDKEIDENTLFSIANKIYKPSYISLETALSHYRLIPESTYLITSVSTRRTYMFETPLTRFFYRTIKPSLFFGYSLLPGGIKMAFIEKAVLDYFYINPAIRTEEGFASLRINRDEMLSHINKNRFIEYVHRFRHKRLLKSMEHFLSWLEYA